MIRLVFVVCIFIRNKRSFKKERKSPKKKDLLSLHDLILGKKKKPPILLSLPPLATFLHDLIIGRGKKKEKKKHSYFPYPPSYHNSLPSPMPNLYVT